MLTLINRLKSDEALMLAYQRGDTAAFDCLYRRHKDGLFAFLYRSCSRHAIVEELAQDAWVGVINSAPTYKTEARFRTWLYQIAHNRLVDFWRRRDNQHTDLENAPEPATAINPAATDELARQLMNAIGQLPNEQRDALLLQEQGFSQREIADITRCAEETVKSRLRYARKQLRQQVGDEL
ncbi:MAG: RNA polymerase subunit sigma [Gammaproteobacteria bacterium]|nr:MAG: RNA polymerase subunit sigma [Gammaproteobacteria bacterium]